MSELEADMSVKSHSDEDFEDFVDKAEMLSGSCKGSFTYIDFISVPLTLQSKQLTLHST